MLDPAYLHRPKQARNRPGLDLGRLHLKWFDLGEAAHPVTEEMRARAQSYVAALHRDPTDLAGFVILHRCGPDFYFLLTSLWRGNNELWQAVHYLDAATPDFTAFPAAYPGPGAPRPTFCVWELGIVAAEARAWQSYLFSPRTAADLARWQSDIRQGPV